MTDDDPADAPAAPTRRRAGRLGALAVMVAMAAMWGYIFVYHLAGGWQEDTPGRLDDRDWGEMAEATCATSMARLDALPPAFEAQDAAERADVIDESNRLLSDMLEELAALPAPSGPEDVERVAEWLDDWAIYVEDRAIYADRLRADPMARFTVTQSDRDERQITTGVDRFAVVNQMPACRTPSDIA